jgi:hypothetical protein
MSPAEGAVDTDSEAELGPEEEDGGEALGDELVALEGEEDLDDEDDDEEEDALGKLLLCYTSTARARLPARCTPAPELVMARDGVRAFSTRPCSCVWGNPISRTVPPYSTQSVINKLLIDPKPTNS